LSVHYFAVYKIESSFYECNPSKPNFGFIELGAVNVQWREKLVERIHLEVQNNAKVTQLGIQVLAISDKIHYEGRKWAR
jgi:hypothetical protein